MSSTTPGITVGETFEADWPGASALSTACVLNLYAAASVLEAKSEAAVRRAGFPSLAAFNVLTVLQGAGEPLPPSVIAQRVFVTRGTMTVVLRSLERRGLIRLLPHPDDGRMRLVEMTPGTSSRVHAFLQHIHAAERTLMSILSSGQQRKLLGTLSNLQVALDQLVL